VEDEGKFLSADLLGFQLGIEQLCPLVQRAETIDFVLVLTSDLCFLAFLLLGQL